MTGARGTGDEGGRWTADVSPILDRAHTLPIGFGRDELEKGIFDV